MASELEKRAALATLLELPGRPKAQAISAQESAEVGSEEGASAEVELAARAEASVGSGSGAASAEVDIYTTTLCCPD